MPPAKASTKEFSMKGFAAPDPVAKLPTAVRVAMKSRRLLTGAYIKISQNVYYVNSLLPGLCLRSAEEDAVKEGIRIEGDLAPHAEAVCEDRRDNGDEREAHLGVRESRDQTAE